MLFRRELVEALRCRAITRKIIGKFVHLKKVNKRKGHARYVGCCPFHDDRSPSFFVYTHEYNSSEKRYFTRKEMLAKNRKWGFKCFGCGKSGDVFTFVMLKKNLEFVQAVNFILDSLDSFRPKHYGYNPNQILIPFSEDEIRIHQPRIKEVKTPSERFFLNFFKVRMNK